MIIKTLSRKSNTGQLVNYIFKYVFRERIKSVSPGKQEQLKTDKNKFIIRHNIRSRSINGMIKEFKENESFRLVHRKDSVKLFHTIISFSIKDKEHINDKLLKDIAKKFIEERGLNNLYAGTVHYSEHIHLHISVSGTQLNGRSSRISKQKLHSIKLALDKYQREKYPKELANSLPEHGKNKRLAKQSIIQTIKAERQTNKQALLECLEKTYLNSKSQKHFLSQLKDLGHEPYFRNGSFQGVKFEGKTKFRTNRLGFDKTKLQVLDRVKANQDFGLKELQKIRDGRNKDLKRTIAEHALKKGTSVNLDKNEQKLMDELSEIRSANDNKEIERVEANEDYDNDIVAEELNNNDYENKEGNDENIDEEFSPETEESI